MTEPDIVEVSVHVAGAPEAVFGYFTDPARYVQWMGSQATLNPALGGTYGSRGPAGVSFEPITNHETLWTITP